MPKSERYIPTKVNRLNFNAKTVIITSLILSCIVVLWLLIVYYNNSLLHWNGSLNKDFFPAFGGFLSSTIGVIVSFTSLILIYYTYKSQQEQLKITTNLVDRQITLSIKPELFLKDYYSNEITTKFDDSEFDKSPDDIPTELRSIDIKIINLGLEAALHIEYSYEYQASELKIFFDKINPRLFEIILDENSGFAEFHDNKEELMSMRSLEQHLHMKDYLLPYKQDNSSISVAIPSLYLIIYYHVMFASFKDHHINMDDFPPCYLNLRYKDLEGKKYRKKFKLIFELHSLILSKEFGNNETMSFKISCEEMH